MICPNCKSHIDNNIFYCNYCGMKLTQDNRHDDQYNYSKNYSEIKNDQVKNHDEQFKYSKRYSDVQKNYQENHDNQYLYSEMYSNISQKRVESDEDYLKAYIGSSYPKVKKEGLSFEALIFGPIDLIYRRMYTPGTLLLILLGLIFYYNFELGMLSNIIINLLLASKRNNMYLEHTTKKVDEIKISNPDKTSSELLDICKQKGKPLTIIILFIVVIGIWILSFIPLLLNNKEVKEVPLKEKIYLLEYQVPKEFTPGKYNSDKTRFYYYENKKTECQISITVKKNISIEKYKKIYLNNSQKEKEKIWNNIKWLSIEAEPNTNDYLIKKEENLYHIHMSNTNNKECQTLEEEFGNSLLFTE